MTQLETLKKLLEITDDNEDELLSEYLLSAKEVILNRLYPFGIPTTVDDVPSIYTKLQIQIAQYLYLKEGAEGEKTHNENGVNRSYESGFVPESMLSQITPYARIMGK